MKGGTGLFVERECQGPVPPTRLLVKKLGAAGFQGRGAWSSDRLSSRIPWKGVSALLAGGQELPWACW